MLVAFMTGGLIPLAPFLSTPEPQTSFLAASILIFAFLFIIDVGKTSFTGKNWLVSGFEMVIVGILAAAIPYAIGTILSPSLMLSS
jgi:VIT1/CCC1 family predicted Fe2+/Mn2+ transporter